MIFKAKHKYFYDDNGSTLKQIKSESDKGTCLNHTSHRQCGDTSHRQFIGDISRLGRIEFAIMLIFLF